MRFKDSIQSLDEGMDAYQKGNYSTALNIWSPLTHYGCDGAQSALGHMSSLGVGLFHDHTVALRRYTLAAEKGNYCAQLSLGIMYQAGQGAQEAMRLP